MPELSKSKTKQLMARARMQKARVHIGMNGITKPVIDAMKRSFSGMCTHPDPCDVVRVKIHPTFTGDLDAAIAMLSHESGSVFVKQEREWLIFWKPND